MISDIHRLKLAAYILEDLCNIDKMEIKDPGSRGSSSMPANLAEIGNIFYYRWFKEIEKYPEKQEKFREGVKESILHLDKIKSELHELLLFQQRAGRKFGDTGLKFNTHAREKNIISDKPINTSK